MEPSRIQAAGITTKSAIMATAHAIRARWVRSAWNRVSVIRGSVRSATSCLFFSPRDVLIGSSRSCE